MKEAFDAINGRVILAIVATYGLGTALESTGTASLIASGLVSVGKRIGAVGLLSMLFLAVALLSCIVSNAATVILLFPVVQDLSGKLNSLSIGQLSVTLMMGASCAFVTPIGYQTNLMIFAPGNYEFIDFAKIGGALVLLLTPVVGFLVFCII